MRKWHPDKNFNNIEEATRMTKEINEAHDILVAQLERHVAHLSA